MANKKNEADKSHSEKQWNMFMIKTDRLCKIQSLFPECFNDHTDGRYNWKTKK